MGWLANLDAAARRHSRAIGLAMVTVVAVGAAARATVKVLTHDELFTAFLSRLDTPHLWTALVAATDLNPPGYYLLVRSVHGWLGTGLLTTRLPSVAGFAVLTGCLFLLGGRSARLSAAVVAATVPSFTAVLAMASDARAYTVVCGCAAAALVFWLRADGAARVRTLVGLALSLALGVSMHYYATLTWLPLIAGELARSWKRRAIDGPVWLAFAAGAVPLVFWIPLMEAARSYASGFWARASLSFVPGSYIGLLDGLAWLIALCLIAAAIASLFPLRAELEPLAPSASSHLVVALVGFCALPAIGVVLAAAGIVPFTTRYAAPAVIGVAGLAGHVIAACPARIRRAVGATALAALVATHVIPAWRARHFSEASVPLMSILERQRPDVAVAVQDPEIFLRLAYSAAPASARVVYVYVRDEQLARSKGDTIDRAMQALGKSSALRVMSRQSFMAAHDTFLLYGQDNWLADDILKAGGRLELIEPGMPGLFLVTIPPVNVDPPGSARPRT